MEVNKKHELLLTILIPSRNRYERLLNLLHSLDEFLTDSQRAISEVLISDNSDTPYDFAEKKLAYGLQIRFIKPKNVLLTAEENLFYGWKFAKGEFVWILGDDDPINFIQVGRLFKTLNSDSHNILFWNSNLVSTSGYLLKTLRIPSRNETFEVTMHDFVARVGAWYGTSGFSTWVIRRTLINPREAAAWIESANRAIYSHVTFFLKSFSNERVFFINKPLVFYRINEYDENGNQSNWLNYASNSGRYYRQSWIYDFPKQIEELVSLNVVDDSYLGQIIEQDHTGNRFPLVLALADLLLEQSEIALGDPSQIIPSEHLNYVLKFLQWYAPTYTPWRNELFALNEKMRCSRKKPLFWYRFRFRKYGADIKIMRYNLWARRQSNPFLDYFPTAHFFDDSFIRKPSDFNLGYFDYIDFGIGSKFSYPISRQTFVEGLNPNMTILRVAQYFPYKLRNFLKKFYRRLKMVFP